MPLKNEKRSLIARTTSDPAGGLGLVEQELRSSLPRLLHDLQCLIMAAQGQWIRDAFDTCERSNDKIFTLDSISEIKDAFNSILDIHV